MTFSTLPVPPRPRTGIAFRQLNNGLWRITRSSGTVLGYVEDSSSTDRLPRFSAKRLSSTGRSFLPLGDFRTFDDAVDCLRFG
ncbi:MAG: hypothetical protein JWR33_423 [Naasia sp.]|jgi:hypothetical protein|uniref:hypothetical protein n=1 Tax=Naasia sp. TaxID=2546198 RepID=UPI0026337F41|nr:hypothetical protein [Naasia sp.]MCU1569682.1 hypothetical protein [Naasia sp.]